MVIFVSLDNLFKQQLEIIHSIKSDPFFTHQIEYIINWFFSELFTYFVFCLRITLREQIHSSVLQFWIITAYHDSQLILKQIHVSKYVTLAS
jgi:hypothetical protein